MTNASDIPLEIHRWTVDDYHRLVEAGILAEDAPVELLNGQIVRMSPVGDLHAACVERLDELLRDILGKSVNVRVQSPVILDDFSEPEPDLAVLRRKENFYSDGHPRPADVLLLVEVSETSVVKDRLIKKPAYAASGIRELWIVHLPEQQVEQYLEPEGEEYRLAHIYKAGQIIESRLTGPVAVSDVLP